MLTCLLSSVMISVYHNLVENNNINKLAFYMELRLFIIIISAVLIIKIFFVIINLRNYNYYPN